MPAVSKKNYGHPGIHTLPVIYPDPIYKVVGSALLTRGVLPQSAFDFLETLIEVQKDTQAQYLLPKIHWYYL